MVRLLSLIDSRRAVIGVIGLGYVGTAVAAAFAKAGFRVIGVDVKMDRVGAINAGRVPFAGKEPDLPELLIEVVGNGRLSATTNYEALREADVVLIDVETPVTPDHRPSFFSLVSACEALGSVLKEGALVIVESTVAPGTTMSLVAPLLEKASGRILDEGFHLGHSPERVMPGRLLLNLETMPRVCGGSSKTATAAMIALYSSIVHADLDATDCVTAELTKAAENTYRDINIALANEVAMLCESAGADFRQVRDLINKCPGRAMLIAGAGVGGHCLPKDPWLLGHGAPREQTRLLATARAVNEEMPIHAARLVESGLSDVGILLHEARICVLGYSYLPNTDDARNSPTAPLVAYLQERGADVTIHDPWHQEFDTDLWDAVRGTHAVVLMVAHDAYIPLDLARLKRELETAVLVDGRHMVEAEAAVEHGFVFRAIGRPSAGNAVQSDRTVSPPANAARDA